LAWRKAVNLSWENYLQREGTAQALSCEPVISYQLSVINYQLCFAQK